MELATEFAMANAAVAEKVESAEMARLSDLDLALIGGGCGEVVFPHSN